MKLKAAAVALGTALALAGAARAATQDPAQQQQQQLIKGSSGFQDGQVSKVEGNTVTVQPYQKKAGVAQLQASSDTKVFALIPNGLVSSAMSSAVLNPGVNVRVYYKSGPNNSQQIVAIQLLPLDEANKLQASQANK